MGQKIKTFSDGSYLEYDRGSIDHWCVYLTDAAGKRKPPRDTDYFLELQTLSNKYGVEAIYAYYVSIYEMTGKEVDNNVLNTITDLSQDYGAEAIHVDTVFSILYLAMISEENRKNTKLGKRIKRLGIYKLLIEKASVSESANFMRGMNWREIDSLCKERGF